MNACHVFILVVFPVLKRQYAWFVSILLNHLLEHFCSPVLVKTLLFTHISIVRFKPVYCISSQILSRALIMPIGIVARGGPLLLQGGHHAHVWTFKMDP